MKKDSKKKWEMDGYTSGLIAGFCFGIALTLYVELCLLNHIKAFLCN